MVILLYPLVHLKFNQVLSPHKRLHYRLQAGMKWQIQLVFLVCMVVSIVKMQMQPQRLQQ